VIGHGNLLITAVHDRYQPNQRTVALHPSNGKSDKGYPHTYHLIEVAADILIAHDAVAQYKVMTRLPFRKILEDITSGFPFVFGTYVGPQRTRSMGTNSRSQWMVQSLLVHTHAFHAFFNEPFACLFIEPWRIAEVLDTIGVFFVPARMNDNDVAFYVLDNMMMTATNTPAPKAKRLYLLRSVSAWGRRCVAPT
jgi:hypothetical protein